MPSDHFNGVQFFNPGQANSDKSLVEVLRWQLSGNRQPWPEIVPAASGVKPAARVPGLQITSIGHASLLIQVANVNILIDPVWSLRAGPFKWLGPRRRNPPAVAFNDLPPVDVVLITHNHYDHLDEATIQRLWHTHEPHILTPLGNDRLLNKSLPAAEIRTGDWWQSFTLPSQIRATIVPAYHWSSRRISDRRMALWGGFVLDTPSGSIYCVGDTAYGGGAIFREVKHTCGSPLVALLPIGGYAPPWFMKSQHVNPEETVKIAMDCDAQQILGIHWNTFPLTDEPYHEPAERLSAAVRASSLDAKRFRAMRPGDTWNAD